MTNLFRNREFRSRSGEMLPWKIECDALVMEDWEWAAKFIASRTKFDTVVGVPRGGLRLANELRAYRDPLRVGSPLVVDDVWTTGLSLMKEMEKWHNPVGWVLFKRTPGPLPSNVRAIWSITA